MFPRSYLEKLALSPFLAGWKKSETKNVALKSANMEKLTSFDERDEYNTDDFNIIAWSRPWFRGLVI